MYFQDTNSNNLEQKKKKKTLKGSISQLIDFMNKTHVGRREESPWKHRRWGPVDAGSGKPG